MHKHNILKWLVTCGGLGLIPIAPGSFGSLGAIVFSAVIFSYLESFFLKVALLIFGTVLSYWLIKIYEDSTRTHDDKSIVIDEWIAQSWVIIFFPLNTFYLLLGFGLFRFFDIVKPFPISWIDKNMHSSLGTLLDDLVAALASILLLFLIKWLL